MASGWRGACCCQVPGCYWNSLPTVDSEGGACTTPPRIVIIITHCCVRDVFQPYGSWSIAQHPPPPRYTQGERVCENRNECCSDWLSEIHLKLWMNCEVAISRLHRGSSICLSMADNVIHLPTSCFFCCSHTSLHVSMSVLTCYAPFLLKVLLSIPFILSLILWCMQRATCDP